MAQDAKTVIANAQKGIGRSRHPSRIRGRPRMWRSSSAAPTRPQMNCQGTHDPMRPITNYVRVIDLGGAGVTRHGGATNNIGPGGSTTPRRERSSSRSRRSRRMSSQPWAQLAGVLPHAVGLPERRGREQRDRGAKQGRRQELHGSDLESRGQGAVGQELRHQRLRQRPEPGRARRDVARRKHHGRHAHRRHLLRLEGFRRRDGAGEDRADARRLAVLRSRRDGGEGESARRRVARAGAGTAGGRGGGPGAAGRAAPAAPAGADRDDREARRRPLPAHDRRRQLRLAARRVQGLRDDARGRTVRGARRWRTSPKRRSCSRTSRSAT